MLKHPVFECIFLMMQKIPKTKPSPIVNCNGKCRNLFSNKIAVMALFSVKLGIENTSRNKLIIEDVTTIICQSKCHNLPCCKVF